MFGLNFVQQGFLLAGLAAGIPILIHLLLRQRAQRVDIGSLRFVRHVVRQHNRMRRIRQWLLLATRVIALLLLAFVFARPFLDKSSLEASQRAVVLMLDQSASMRLKDSNDSTVFHEARDALKRELEDSHDNTLVHVAAFDAQSVRTIPLESIDSLEAGYGSTDYERALAWARDILQKSGRGEKRVLMYTDLQQIGVRRLNDDAWPADIELQVIDMGQPFARNVIIDRVEILSSEIRPKLPPTLAVDLRNGGPISLTQFDVTLAAEGNGTNIRQSKSVALGGAERKRLLFQLDGLSPGTFQGDVRLQRSDAVSFDDKRYFALEARLPDRLLIIDGQEGDSVFSSETYFLETALQLGIKRPSNDIPTFETERIVWDNGEGFPNLTGFRAIVLANVGRFTSTDIRRLQSYVETGGRLLYFAGDRFNAQVANPLFEAGVLPARFEDSDGEGEYRIAKWEQQHPIFMPFDDPQYGDLRQIRFRRIAAAQPGNDATVLARSVDGEPILIEQIVGDGRVLLMTTTADRAWSDWPQDRLYVPFQRQIMAYLTDQHLRQQRIVAEHAGNTQDTRPGVSQRDNVLVVRNVDPNESELARISVDDFREAMNLPDVTPVQNLTEAELAILAPPVGSQRANEIWPIFIWLLLAVLILETLLAGRIHG